MNSRLAVISFLDNDPNQPNQGLPGIPGLPNQGLPSQPVYPSQGLPGGGHIATLPVFPFDPTVPSNELPSSQPGADNSLPRPGKKYIVKWLACVGLILVPDNSLPGSGSGRPDNELPETAEPR